MGKFYAFLLGLGAGFGLCHFATWNHVILASDGLHMASKVSGTLEDAYVDIRGFTAADAASRPALAQAIAQSGNEQLQKEFLGGIVQNEAENLIDGMEQP